MDEGNGIGGYEISEDIKKECKSENKNDSISTVIKWLKCLATRVPNQDDLCKNLEILRLKTILK